MSSSHMCALISSAFNLFLGGFEALDDIMSHITCSDSLARSAWEEILTDFDTRILSWSRRY
jgi:hypothetical protein